MVMNTDEAAFNTLIEYDLEPELFSIAILQKFLIFAAKNALIDYPVHLKLDTGMHRLGFEEKEMGSLGKLLKLDNCVQVKTVFSHLVSSEDPGSDPYTIAQDALFGKLCNELQTALGYSFIRHLANSAAIERHPQLQHDMVRIGIGMYGVTNMQTLHVHQVATLKTTIAQIKTVSPPETVGYNRKGVVNRTSKIATVRIGYADGYNRQLGNGRGKMLVNGQLAPTIGNICMDMTMLDITDIANVQEEDYVIVFGDNLPVMELAKWCDTIPYEILTGISQRVKRVYFGE
jgi:alanine racemase